MTLDDQQFYSALRSALHYLYEPDQLHRSPLIEFFGLAGRVDATLALQQILLDAVQALKPGGSSPPQSKAWLYYDLLFFRYVRGYDRIKVADQLGISDRQLSREQKNAIEALAQHLLKTRRPALPPEQPAQAWVETLPAGKPSPWKPVLLSVTGLLRPLIQENGVLVRCQPDDSLPDLPVPQAALRHSLLTLLGRMIPLARQAELVIEPALAGRRLMITVWVLGREFAFDPADPEIDASRRLVEQVGGSLEPASAPGRAGVRLAVPALAQAAVLVIDDNPDTIQLFQRYAQGSRYTVIGLQDPAAAFQTIEKIRPRIIVVDVMMPELDGWDLITQLRLNHQAQNTAVVVCSILPQESLALSLGADGFLQKPVLPEAFLEMLDRQMERFSQEPDNS